VSSGDRREIARFKFDLGASYYYYAGKFPTDTTKYREYSLGVRARADARRPAKFKPTK